MERVTTWVLDLLNWPKSKPPATVGSQSYRDVTGQSAASEAKRPGWIEKERRRFHSTGTRRAGYGILNRLPAPRATTRAIWRSSEYRRTWPFSSPSFVLGLDLCVFYRTRLT
jgi:hypothetical protein